MTASTEGLRGEWMRATDRTTRARAFFTGYAPADGSAGGRHFTDIELAFAWLYQDVAHGDAVTTGHFDMTDRYRAAVNVFSSMAVVALETLEYINELVELEVITLPVGTFADTVIVTDREHVARGVAFIETDVSDDLTDPAGVLASPPAPSDGDDARHGAAAQRGPRVRRGVSADSACARAVGAPDQTNRERSCAVAGIGVRIDIMRGGLGSRCSRLSYSQAARAASEVL